MPQINLKNCTLYIADGLAATCKRVVVPIGDGNITWDITRNIEYTLERGNLASGTARLGDEAPVSVSFDIRFDHWNSDLATYTPVGALLKDADVAADWTSTAADACEAWAVDLYIERDLGTCYEGTNRYEIYYFEKFRAESVGADLDGGSISVSGTCQVKDVVVTRQDTALLAELPFHATGS